jgi:hypothetical protein
MKIVMFRTLLYSFMLLKFTGVDGTCGENCTLVLQSPLENSIFRIGMIPVLFISHGSDCNHTGMWVDVEVSAYVLIFSRLAR